MNHNNALSEKSLVIINHLYITLSRMKNVSRIIFNIFLETWLVPLPNLAPVELTQLIPTEAKVSSTQTHCSFMRRPEQWMMHADCADKEGLQPGPHWGKADMGCIG